MKKSLLVFSSTVLLAFTPTHFGLPDLQPDTNTAISYAIQAGNNISCYTKALNLSNPTKDFFKVGFYLSPDSLISPDDILIGSSLVDPLNPLSMNCSALNIDLTLKNVPDGIYYIGTYIDYEDAVREDDAISNNSLAFRDAGGVFKKVNYPGTDVGIPTNAPLGSEIEKHYSVNGDLLIKTSNEEEITVELFSLEGKLIHKEKSKSVSISPKSSEIFILRITTKKGITTEKIIL